MEIPLTISPGISTQWQNYNTLQLVGKVAISFSKTAKQYYIVQPKNKRKQKKEDNISTNV